MSVALIIKVKRTQIPEVSVSCPFRENKKEVPKSIADIFAVLKTTEIRGDFMRQSYCSNSEEHMQQR